MSSPASPHGKGSRRRTPRQKKTSKGLNPIRAGAAALHYQGTQNDPYSVQHEKVLAHVQKELSVSPAVAERLVKQFEYMLEDFTHHHPIQSRSKRKSEMVPWVMGRYKLSENRAKLFLETLVIYAKKR